MTARTAAQVSLTRDYCPWLIVIVAVDSYPWLIFPELLPEPNRLPPRPRITYSLVTEIHLGLRKLGEINCLGRLIWVFQSVFPSQPKLRGSWWLVTSLLWVALSENDEDRAATYIFWNSSRGQGQAQRGACYGSTQGRRLMGAVSSGESSRRFFFFLLGRDGQFAGTSIPP